MQTILLKNYTSLSEKEQIDILSIRNQEYIREVSLNQKPIQIQEHLAWAKELIHDKNKMFYAIIFENKIIGGVNIFNLQENPSWGIFFLENADILVKTITPIYFFEYLFSNFTLQTIHAQVLSQNINAISFNKNLGFKEIATINDIIELQLQYEAFEKKKKSLLFKQILKKMKQFDFAIKG